jgi:uridine kinase
LRSTGDLADVRVTAHPEGLLVEMGERLHEGARPRHDTRIDPVLQELTTPRFGGEMVRAQREWQAAMSVTSVGSFNDACVSGRVSELVRVSEGFHEKWIGKIADAIAAKKDGLRVIRVAGPSSSGKTTFIKRLRVQLEIDGMHPKNLSLDDYYLDREKTPRDERGDYDFEALEAIDLDLLRAHLAALLRGETVKTARFDFLTGAQLREAGPEITLRHGDVLLVEGIHGLNPALLEPRDETAFGVFIHPASTLPFDRLNGLAPEDVRLLRRIVRDRHGRGASAADNILRWPSVRRGEQAHIFPCAPFADVVFDSSLVYELSVIKVFAERYLLEVEEDHPAFPTAFRLRSLVDRFVAITPEHVPPTSIVREFIGGSGFEY